MRRARHVRRVAAGGVCRESNVGGKSGARAPSKEMAQPEENQTSGVKRNEETWLLPNLRPVLSMSANQRQWRHLSCLVAYRRLIVNEANSCFGVAHHAVSPVPAYAKNSRHPQQKTAPAAGTINGYRRRRVSGGARRLKSASGGGILAKWRHLSRCLGGAASVMAAQQQNSRQPSVIGVSAQHQHRHQLKSGHCCCVGVGEPISS